MKNFITKNKYLLIGLFLIVFIWFLLSILINNQFVIPRISSVLLALINLLKIPNTYFVITKTILNLIITLSFSLLISLILVILSAISFKFEEIIRPLMILLKTIPVASVIIIFLVILGSNLSPYIITLMVCLPIMYEGINNGIKTIDHNLLDEIKMHSKITINVLLKIHFPLSLPHIITSLVQSLGLGLKVMVMAEFIAQPINSIGYEMMMEKNYLAMDKVFAWTIILILFVLVFEILLQKTKKRYQNIVN